MNTKIFFAFDEKIPRGILQDLTRMGADCRQLEYDPYLKEEICYLKVKSKPQLLKVLQFFQNLNDYRFKYHQLMEDKLKYLAPASF